MIGRLASVPSALAFLAGLATLDVQLELVRSEAEKTSLFTQMNAVWMSAFSGEAAPFLMAFGCLIAAAMILLGIGIYKTPQQKKWSVLLLMAGLLSLNPFGMALAVMGSLLGFLRAGKKGTAVPD